MKRIVTLLFILTACTGVVQKGAVVTGATPTATPNYSCSYFDTSTQLYFDDLTTCQSSTGAVCSSEWETYPTGGLSLCYKPPTDFSACLVSPPTWDWNYTPWTNWCGDNAGTTFYRYRSMLGCSSTACNCTSSVVTVDSCSSSATCLAKTLAPFDPSSAQVPSCTQGRCPIGYVPVTANSVVGTTNDFCVMQYEAKPWTDANANGIVESSEVSNTGTIPVSTAFGQPWVSISKGNAKSKCQALGIKYDLISNSEWMTIARDIEVTASNWSSGVVGTGCLRQGNAGAGTTCGYNAGAIEGTTKSVPAKAQHNLSNASVIWDFSGNVSEWVDLTISNLLDAEITGGSCLSGVSWAELTNPIACTNLPATYIQPLTATYTSTNGIGELQNLHNSPPMTGLFVKRGGNYLDGLHAGVFQVSLESDGTADTATGFRCVYHP